MGGMYIVYYNKHQNKATIHYADCGLTSRRRSTGPFLTKGSASQYAQTLTHRKPRECEVCL